MKKKKRTLLDLDHIPTLDELRAYFKENDFSAATYVDVDYETMDAESVEALEYIKGLMDEKWEPLSREMGLKSDSSYYGKDNPLIAMCNNMESLVAGGVMKLLNEKPEVAAEILDHFFQDPDVEQHADDFLNNAGKTRNSRRSFRITPHTRTSITINSTTTAPRILTVNGIILAQKPKPSRLTRWRIP